jgi:hypothetical protein
MSIGLDVEEVQIMPRTISRFHSMFLCGVVTSILSLTYTINYCGTYL